MKRIKAAPALRGRRPGKFGKRFIPACWRGRKVGEHRPQFFRVGTIRLGQCQSRKGCRLDLRTSRRQKFHDRQRTAAGHPTLSQYAYLGIVVDVHAWYRKKEIWTGDI